MNTRYTSVKSDRKIVTTAGTRVALAAAEVRASQVDITAETDNTDYVVVGGADVIAATATRKGIPLLPGQSITIFTDRLEKIYLDSMIDGEGVTFNYYD